MSEPVKGVMEDIRKGLLLNDFSGGIVTDTGGLSLGPNQSPDSLNVFAWQGNLHFRGGYDEHSTLPAACDGAYTYYDRNSNVHMVHWAGGNMYDVITGTPVLIAAGVYTPGQIIAHAQLNGVLYWATLTVPLRYWDSVTEGPVVSGGGTGTVAPPACLYLVDFNGSLIAVNVVVAGVPNPGAFMWSNVNDPTRWVGANTQAVGSNDGGSCVFAILMGISSLQVTPTKQFMVGKDNRQIFLYAGALGALTENAISSPVGILQGGSATYIPTQQGLGAVMFLGTDGQFYLTNGVTCDLASDNIKLLCSNLVNASLTANPNQRFNAIYNQRFQYYQCDIGGDTQLIYKWDTAAWWLFRGWPSGIYSDAPVRFGLPSVFVGANFGSTTGVYELALDQTDDNGLYITAYWTSPYLHGGKPERLKIFQEVTMFAYNVGCQYSVTGYAMPQSNGLVPTTTPLLFNDPAVGAVPPQDGSAALWGVSLWGLAEWTGGNITAAQPYSIGGMKGPLVVPSPISKWGPAGYPTPLRTGAAQFKVAWNGGIPDFRMTSFKVAYLPQNENVGILPFSGQGQQMNIAPNFGNPFTNTGHAGYGTVSQERLRGYRIIGGILYYEANQGEYVAFALGDVSSGSNPTTVYAWNNLGDSATVGTIDNASGGESGIAVSLENVVFSQVNADDGDLTLTVESILGVSGETSSLTGSFAPPASINYIAYQGGTFDQYQVSTIVLTADRAFLFAGAATIGAANGLIVKIDVDSGAIVATSDDVGRDAPGAIYISPDGSRIYFVGRGSTSAHLLVATFSTTDLSTINSTEILVASSLPVAISAALAPDGTSLAMTVLDRAPNPDEIACYIFDTTAFSFSSFTVGVDTTFSGAVTYPAGDSANVLIYLNYNILTFDLTGSAGTVYALGLTNDDGCNNMITEPNTGLIYGTSYLTTTDNAAWVYDLNTQSLLTEVTLPPTGGMPAITFAV